MPIYVPKQNEEAFTRERVPAGTHQAVCTAVHDIGVQENTYNGETKRQHKCIVVWEVNERITSGKFVGQRFVVSKRYTLSLHEKSTLRHDLASWRGRDFTIEELNNFDLEKLYGANCLLAITETDKGGKTYSNITAVMALPKGTEKIKPELEPDHRFDWIEVLKGKQVSITDATDADVLTDSLDDPHAKIPQGKDIPF